MTGASEALENAVRRARLEAVAELLEAAAAVLRVDQVEASLQGARQAVALLERVAGAAGGRP